MDCPSSTTPTTSQRNTFLDIQELPNWFSLENYSCASQLDLEGWIVQLHLRQMIKAEISYLSMLPFINTKSVESLHLATEP